MADRKEEHSYGPRRTVGMAGYAAERVASIPAVENWMRGPAAERFAQIAEQAGKAGYTGADDAARVFAHRMTANSRQAHELAIDMRRFIRRNPVPAAPAAAVPAATTTASTAAQAARGVGEGTADFVARKIADAKIGPRTWKGLVQAAKKGASGLGNILLGPKGARLATAGKSGAWALAIHGTIEGGGATIDLARDLMDPVNRQQIGGRSAWYDYVNPLPVKGGINPDEVQHNLSNSLKRLASGVLTFGIADWGQGEYDPMSDPDSWAAQAERARRAAGSIREQWYRDEANAVKKFSTFTPGSDVGEFLRTAVQAAKERREGADKREKSLPARVPGKPENSTIAYARELVAARRKSAYDIATGALASVRDAYKDDQAGYRKMLEEKVDREILPFVFKEDNLPAGYRVGMKFTDAAFGERVQKFRDELLADPKNELGILSFQKEVPDAGR